MTAGISNSSAQIGLAPQTMAPAQNGIAAAGSQASPFTNANQAGNPNSALSPDPTAAGALGGATAGANGVLGKLLSPNALIGGGAVAAGGGLYAALGSKMAGNKYMRYAGIAAAVGGLGLAALGLTSKGAEQGKKQAEQEMLPQFQAYDAQVAEVIAGLQQQAQQGGAGNGSLNGTDGGAGTGIGPGAGIGVDGSTNQDALTGSVFGEQGSATIDVPGVQNASPQTAGLIGKSVQLAPGKNGNGIQIAEGGNYRIESVIGDAAGYNSLDAANNAVKAAVSTETMGSRFLRYMVIQDAQQRFHAVVAKQLEAGEPAQALAQTDGEVVAWNALGFVDANGGSGWQAYSWTKQSGSQSHAVAYGDVPFPNAGVGGTDGVSGGGVSSGGVSSGGIDSGSGVNGAVFFNPANSIGLTFSVNASTTAEGVSAAGGALQLQSLLPSSQAGFTSAAEAADAARSARYQAATSGQANQFTRWVTVQGSDQRFYVYQGSLVARETSPLNEAAPLHVFGLNFSSYFDANQSAWQAVTDR